MTSTSVPFRINRFQTLPFNVFRVNEHLASHFCKPLRSLSIPFNFQKRDEAPQPRINSPRKLTRKENNLRPPLNRVSSPLWACRVGQAASTPKHWVRQGQALGWTSAWASGVGNWSKDSKTPCQNLKYQNKKQNQRCARKQKHQRWW